MPTYGYECLECADLFEVVQSIKDDPLKNCRLCGGSLRKRIYPVGIAFKGPGFYVNDYAPGKAASRESGAESAAKPDAAGESSSKSEVPAPKPQAPDTKSENAAPKVESSATKTEASTTTG